MLAIVGAASLAFRVPYVFIDLQSPLGRWDRWVYQVAAGRYRSLYYTHPSFYFNLLGTLWRFLFVIFISPGSSSIEMQAAYFAHPLLFPIIASVFGIIMGSLGCVLLAQIGSRLRDDAVGLYAGIAAALCIPLARWSAMTSVDMTATTIGLAAVLACLDVFDRATRRDSIVAGALTGLAVATNWDMALVGVVLVAAHAWGGTSVDGRDVAPPTRVRRFTWACLSAALVLLVASPQIVLDWNAIWRDLLFQLENVVRVTEHRESNSNPFFYVLALFDTSQGLGLAAVLAFIGLIRALLGRDRRILMVLAFPIVYLSVFTLMKTREVRWLLPAFPLMLLAGARVVSAWLKVAGPRLRGCAAIALVLLFVVAPVAEIVIISSNRWEMPPPQVRLVNWLLQNVPSGDRLATDQSVYFDQLPLISGNRVGPEANLAMWLALAKAYPRAFHHVVEFSESRGRDTAPYDPGLFISDHIGWMIVSDDLRNHEDIRRYDPDRFRQYAAFYDWLDQNGQVMTRIMATTDVVSNGISEYGLGLREALFGQLKPVYTVYRLPTGRAQTGGCVPLNVSDARLQVWDCTGNASRPPVEFRLCTGAAGECSTLSHPEQISAEVDGLTKRLPNGGLEAFPDRSGGSGSG